MPVDAPTETPTRTPLPSGLLMADTADAFVRSLPVKRPRLSHGGEPPFPPGNDDDGDDRRPHRTWGQQLHESVTHADVLRAGGLLTLLPQREVKSTLKGINAAARALRHGGRKRGNPVGEAFRDSFRETTRNFDDMTNENRWHVRGVGAFAIALVGYTVLSNTAFAPVAISR